MKELNTMFYKSIKNQPNVTYQQNDPVIKWHFRQGKIIRYKSTYNGISTYTEYKAYSVMPYIIAVIALLVIAFII